MLHTVSRCVTEKNSYGLVYSHTLGEDWEESTDTSNYVETDSSRPLVRVGNMDVMNRSLPSFQIISLYHEAEPLTHIGKTIAWIHPGHNHEPYPQEKCCPPENIEEQPQSEIRQQT